MKKLIMLLFLCFSLQSVFAQDTTKRTRRDDIPDDNPWKGLLEMIGDEEEVSEAEAKKNLTLDERALGDYNVHILEKVTLLTNYISLIADKNKPESARTSSLNAAVKLFLSEKKIVEVSNLKNTKPLRIPVRAYFNRIKNANAYKVEIKFYEVAKLSPLKLGPDGNYYATAYIYQAYAALDKDNNIKYKDKTVKKVEIICTVSEQKVGDQINTILIVQLGNINVDETKENTDQ